MLCIINKHVNYLMVQSNYDSNVFGKDINRRDFESITTVDSKLFNDKKDYERYKHFYVRDDDIFIEEIIGELK